MLFIELTFIVWSMMNSNIIQIDTSFSLIKYCMYLYLNK